MFSSFSWQLNTLLSVSCNNIPFHLKRYSPFTYHQFRSSGAIRNALTLLKNPVCTRHGSTEDTWYEERVATQQDRSSTWDIPSSSLAKVGNPLGGVSYCLASLAFYSLLSHLLPYLPGPLPRLPSLSRSTRTFVSFSARASPPSLYSLPLAFSFSLSLSSYSLSSLRGCQESTGRKLAEGRR